MALYKQIEQKNGLVLAYHRVASVNIITNIHNVIEVQSYISENQREKEKQDPSFSNVYVEAIYLNVDYNQNMSVDNAYEYLKQLEMFQEATDC